jgi:hypothetical protein
MGVTCFATMHAWGQGAAYASQSLDPIGRAWHTNAKVKARLLGNADPDEWDLPLRPTGMRWATCEKWEARYNAAEDALDLHCGLALARPIGLNAKAPQVIAIAPPPAGYKRHFEMI